MTSKVYKTAQGKSVDLGTIMLQNSHTRAVGNMNVNARGDTLDSGNKVIETKSQQIQRQNAQTTNVTSTTIHTSTRSAKRAQAAQSDISEAADTSTVDTVTTTPDIPVENIVAAPAPVDDIASAGGGLAAAIARSKVIKQEKEKTARQLQQSTPGVRKI
jgi:hypothetical protein